MQALRKELLPPSGVEFAATLNLTPATIASGSGKRVLGNLVVARSSFLRVFEVREEPAPLPPPVDDPSVGGRKGTEAVEGEVEMDEQGEGFVNVGFVKSAAQNQNIIQQTVTRLYLVRSHRLHGTVTGLDRVQTLATTEDKLDRLLVSFKDAKIALLEWSEALYDLTTVSIHTYERAPQLLSFNASSHQSLLRVDPISRCAALSLPKDSIAILPFYQSQADLDVGEQDQAFAKDVPYSPSFILDLAEVDERIHNVIDYAFLTGFNNPTLAVLFETQQTWTGRLKEYKDTVSLFIMTIDLNTRTYPIISQVQSLPYDCFSVLPCPASYGGVIILAATSLLHVDQTGRTICVPSSGWASRLTDVKLAEDPAAKTRNIALEGSRMMFVDEKTLFLIAVDGIVHPVELVVEGKVVINLVISSPLAQLTIPTVLSNIGSEHVFVGSAVGPSMLLKTVKVLEEIKKGVSDPLGAAKVETPEVDMDLDDDIYGERVTPSHAMTNGLHNGLVPAVDTKTVIHLSLRDSLREYGPISDMVFSVARNGERAVPELVACTGSEHLGGFTLFQRDLPTRLKRKLHAIGGSRGVWSLSVRPGSKSGITTMGHSGIRSEDDSIIVSTDATPAPGLSRMASRSAKSDMTIFGRATVTTIGAASFFQRTAILQVTTNSLRVLETDGTERQVIKDMEGNMTRPKIRACSIADPFILILREDDTLGLFVGQAERGKIRRKDMSAMGEKASRYLSASFCTDQADLFRVVTNPATAHGKGKGKSQTTTLEAATDTARGTQWLVLCRPNGVLEIWALPKLTLTFSTSLVGTLQGVLTDSYDPVSKSLPEDSARKPQDFDIEQALIAPIGESNPTAHLLLYLKCGHLAIYKISSTAPPEKFPSAGIRDSFLLIQLTKIISRQFDIAEESDQVPIPESRRIQRRLIPFVTTSQSDASLTGLFFTGDHPHWIVGTNQSGVKLLPCTHPIVHAFTTCSVWESKSDFLLYTDEGPCLIEWMPDVSLDSGIPSRSVPRERAYSNIIYDTSTGLLVAAASLKAPFVMFDDEGNYLWRPDAPNIGDPKMECSSLELISPNDWITMDGFEFPANEFVNALENISLETLSTTTGMKDFIAVATTVYRGEDLAVKGATYIFEIVEVVPDPAISKRRHHLRLHCRDDAKGAVTALCGINGYLVSSMGQKIFVRAFDMDERLVGVAFLDVGVYVTCLRSLKNVLLIGDAVKSVWFVAFQEDPFKLVILGRHAQHACVTNVDFFFRDGNMAIVAGDDEGVIRIFEYDPTNVESRGGQQLILQTEFHGQSEYRTSITTMSRTKPDFPYSRLFCGSVDGTLSVLLPVDEHVYKRLQLLQGQLTRNVQHVAGLNPKAFRMVRNEYASRPLTKGILDDGLLKIFDDLPVPKQVEMTRQIASDRATIVKDLLALGGSW